MSRDDTRQTTTHVVLLPGGNTDSSLASRPWLPANLRMAWLQLALRQRLPRDVAISRVR